MIERHAGTVAEQRRREDMEAAVERQQALMEYIAVMADVELPEDGAESANGMNDMDETDEEAEA